MTDRIRGLIRWIREFARTRFHYENENLPYYVTIVLAVAVFVLAVNGFIELTEELAENELTSFDETVANYVTSFRSAANTRWFTFITHLGDRYAYLAVSLVLAAWFYLRYKNWKFVVQTIGVLLLASLSNVVLKEVIHRQRPELEHLVTVSTLSYPSGHAMSAMAFYGFLIHLCLRHSMSRFMRIGAIVTLTLLIIAIGLSRVYLGVHYPSDVVAGWAGGLIAIAFCAVLFEIIALMRKRQGNGKAPDG